MAAITPKKSHPRTRSGPRKAPFETEASRVLARLQRCLGRVLADLPGVNRRASDVRQTLNIDKMLAWQVFTFATSENPLAAGSDLPGSAALRNFLRAAERKGVSAATIRQAQAGAEELEHLIADHAGNRKTFDAMLGGLGGEAAQPIDLACRRQAFHCNSRILGVQSKVQVAWCALQPNVKNPQRVDVAYLRGFDGLRRLRSDAPLILSRIRFTETASGAVVPVRPQPLVLADDAEPGFSLLPDFCTKPLPRLRSCPTDEGFMNIEADDNGIGNQSTLTCFTGYVINDAADRYAKFDGDYDATHVLVRTPLEVLIIDLLVHETTRPNATPRVCVYSDHACADPDISNPIRKRDLLPQRETVMPLGKGAQVLSTPDVPRYAEMAQFAFDQLGWDGQKFDVYRCRVEYPVTPSSVVVQFDLPDPPK